MKASFVLAISTLLITSSLLFCTDKKKYEPSLPVDKSTQTLTITGKVVVDTLESLGYFRFADKDKIDTLKRDIGKTFDEHKVLTTVTSDNPPSEPYCRRLYSCDGEELFELGGLVEYLKEVKPTFDKLGIPLNWSNENWSNDGSEHTIVLNGKKYFAFKGNPNDLLIWGWATKNFAEMLNDQLQLHNSDERVYPISGGNEGRIIFLTSKQYEFISRHFDEKERPKDVAAWWKQNT